MRITIACTLLLTLALPGFADGKKEKVNHPRITVEIPVKGLEKLDTEALKTALKKQLKKRATLDIGKKSRVILLKTRHKLSVDLSEIVSIANAFAKKQGKTLDWSYRDVELKGHIVVTLGRLQGFKLERKEIAAMNAKILAALDKIDGVKASGVPLTGTFALDVKPDEGCSLGDVDSAIARAVGYTEEEAEKAMPVADVRWVGPEGRDTRKRAFSGRKGSGCRCKRGGRR